MDYDKAAFKYKEASEAIESARAGLSLLEETARKASKEKKRSRKKNPRKVRRPRKARTLPPRLQRRLRNPRQLPRKPRLLLR